MGEIIKGHRTNIIKLFISIIYECSQLAKVSVPDKPFKPILMFVGKARSLS